MTQSDDRRHTHSHRDVLVRDVLVRCRGSRPSLVAGVRVKGNRIISAEWRDACGTRDGDRVGERVQGRLSQVPVRRKGDGDRTSAPETPVPVCVCGGSLEGRDPGSRVPTSNKSFAFPRDPLFLPHSFERLPFPSSLLTPNPRQANVADV